MSARLLRSGCSDFNWSGTDLKIAALASLALAGISLGASTMHLGRPIHAWKAMRGLRRSWLSREVLTLSLFAGAAGAFAGMLFFGLPGREAAGFATALAGLAGVTCSARIYIVRARPGVVQRLHTRRVLLDRAAAGSCVRSCARSARAGGGRCSRLWRAARRN